MDIQWVDFLNPLYFCVFKARLVVDDQVIKRYYGYMPNLHKLMAYARGHRLPAEGLK